MAFSRLFDIYIIYLIGVYVVFLLKYTRLQRPTEWWEETVYKIMLKLFFYLL